MGGLYTGLTWVSRCSGGNDSCRIRYIAYRKAALSAPRFPASLFIGGCNCVLASNATTNKLPKLAPASGSLLPTNTSSNHSPGFGITCLGVGRVGVGLLPWGMLVTRSGLVDDLGKLGVRAGGVVMVH